VFSDAGLHATFNVIMITVRHLNESRSQRILWLLEELDVPYDIEWYWSDSQTPVAPPELKSIHPLGRSPVVTGNGCIVTDSGAVVDYIIRHYGNGHLQPASSSPEYDAYVQWMHYAEGSAMLPLLLKLTLAQLGEAARSIMPWIEAAIGNQLAYIDSSLCTRDYLLGNQLTGADVQLSFVGELAAARLDCSAYPNMIAWIRRFQARPAYQAALEQGGPYAFAL
jgi:glutathione S-transferase